jgi:uncharacterized protein (DUF2141 family)
MIALFDNSESFEQRAEPLRAEVIQAKGAECVWRVTGLSPGAYAVAAFQDRNANEELDKRTFGIPVERYGFSHHPVGRFRPPSFDKAKVEFQGEDLEIDVVLR